MNRIIFKEIPREKALVKIDSGDIDDLYFAYYYEYVPYSNQLIGEKIIENPIKYEKPVKLFGINMNSGNQPNDKGSGSARKGYTHRWLVKEVEGYLNNNKSMPYGFMTPIDIQKEREEKFEKIFENYKDIDLSIDRLNDFQMELKEAGIEGKTEELIFRIEESK